MISNSTIEQALDKIHQFFDRDELDKFAKESSFVMRITNKLIPLHFFILMVIESIRFPSLSLGGMTSILASMSGIDVITPQALSQRLHNPFTVRFLQRCYGRILRERLKLDSDARIKGVLGRFRTVLLEDSTLCNLHEKTSTLFKGVGGGASKSSYKIHLLWNATNSDVSSVTVTDGKVTDQSTAKNILRFIKNGDLILRDLGYFSLEIFAEIHKIGAFFVSRLKRGVTIYTENGEKIADPSRYFESVLNNDNLSEIRVFIGKYSKFPVRLVISKVPDEVYNQRMRRAKQVAKNNGYTVNSATKKWNRYTVYITNAPEQILSAEELSVVYKLRWQIELVFKSWKSLLRIEIIKGYNPNRVMCYILSRLIFILLVSTMYAHVAEFTRRVLGKTLSLPKFVNWLILEVDCLTNPLDKGKLLNNLSLVIKFLCTQQRSRKTTSELLEEEMTYFDLYPPVVPSMSLA